jgi:predicted DNA-binding transcriptional regulator AlpA
MSKTALLGSAAAIAPVATAEVARLEHFLTLKEVKAATKQSKTVIYRKMAEGEFPRQVRIESKPGACRAIVVWVESEVIRWQQEQIAHRDKRPAAPSPIAATKARAKSTIPEELARAGSRSGRSRDRSKPLAATTA